MADSVPSAGARSAVIGPAVEKIPDQALIVVRGKSDLIGFAAVLGVAPPRTPNSFVETMGRLVAWLGPDEWLIVDQAGEEEELCKRLDAALEGTHHSVTDISGSRAVFRLRGPTSYELLSAGSPFDFHPRSFAAGRSAQTIFARTNAWVLKRDDLPTFDIFVRQSYAFYFEQWLLSALSALPTEPGLLDHR
jgi:sarcosine oxidase subunit gamma